jgi:hypothetical protein
MNIAEFREIMNDTGYVGECVRDAQGYFIWVRYWYDGSDEQKCLALKFGAWELKYLGDHAVGYAKALIEKKLKGYS